jgi:hypothetical protein
LNKNVFIIYNIPIVEKFKINENRNLSMFFELVKNFVEEYNIAF